MTKSFCTDASPDTGVIMKARAARCAASFSWPSVGKSPPPSNLRKSRRSADDESPNPASPAPPADVPAVTTVLPPSSNTSSAKSHAARFSSRGPAQTSASDISRFKGNILSGCGALKRTDFRGRASLRGILVRLVL